MLDLLADYRRSGEWDRARMELSGSAHGQLAEPLSFELLWLD